MVEVDGSYLEGGGQILRTASALSVVTGRPCRVYNVRKGREKPGLRTQHLMGLEALARFCGGRLEGGRVGSEDVSFIPGDGRAGEVEVDIATAGSITLVLQTLTIAAVAGDKPVTVSFRGGATDTFFSPTMDYFTHVFAGVLGRLGVRVEVEIARRGYYPKGGAEAAVKICPGRLKAVRLVERGALQKVTVYSGASESLSERRVAERQAEAARRALARLGAPVEERCSYHGSFSPGSSICLVADFSNTVLGFDGLGQRGKKAEYVGEEAARGLMEEVTSGACLDRHLSDQVLPFMAMAGADGSFTASRITDHARTNMWVIEKFLGGRFEVQGDTVRYLSGRQHR